MQSCTSGAQILVSSFCEFVPDFLPFSVGKLCVGAQFNIINYNYYITTAKFTTL
jgi:hypothetical protein